DDVRIAGHLRGGSQRLSLCGGDGPCGVRGPLQIAGYDGIQRNVLEPEPQALRLAAPFGGKGHVHRPRVHPGAVSHAFPVADEVKAQHVTPPRIRHSTAVHTARTAISVPSHSAPNVSPVKPPSLAAKNRAPAHAAKPVTATAASPTL